MKEANRSNLLMPFLAGLIAITINTLILKAAPFFHIQAENGGLLKLLLIHCPGPAVHYSFFKTPLFQLAFHYITGFMIVTLYFVVFIKLMKFNGWIKGSIFGLLPWIINSVLVLPLLGMGIFGYAHTPIPGILYFFMANIIFGLSLGWSADWLNSRKNKLR